MSSQKQNLTEKPEEPGLIECPKCKGSGDAPVVPNPRAWERMFNPCGKCNGKGKISWVDLATGRRID